MSQQNHLTYEDVLEIVELIKSSGHFAEFHLKVGDIEVDLRRNGAAGPSTTRVPPAPAAARAPDPVAQPGAPATSPFPPAPQPAASAAGTARAEATWPAGSVVVRSPMVGTFYRAPQPGASPFVEVGGEVAADTVVCIIEVMKLMNSIPAGASGVVTHILVEDAAPVEYGQPLVVLRPK